MSVVEGRGSNFVGFRSAGRSWADETYIYVPFCRVRDRVRDSLSELDVFEMCCTGCSVPFREVAREQAHSGPLTIEEIR